jgi:HSP20 family molecular chaperone IbpA
VAVMRAVGYHPLPAHARVRTTDTEYVVELDVGDFTLVDLAVEALGPLVTVRGEQHETEADAGLPFRIRERLEETFRLPDDVSLDSLAAYFKHGVLELRVTRAPLQPRRIRIARRRSGLLNADAVGV